MAIHKDAPAFPQFQPDNVPGVGWFGLTKREYFAAMAMQGLSAHAYATGESSAKVIAAWAVKQADALIAALNKGSQS